jgi:hypothetical protein
VSVEIWSAIGAVSGLIVGLGGWLIAYPKHRSEGRKFDAEAEHINWTTMRGEIDRLNAKLAKQDERIAELEKLDGERESREADLLRENRQLRQKVKRLENRVAGLEGVFKVGPIPPDMQAAIDKLKDVE